MDYLQEGINLRAMGQQDPLVEWQREGFDMFGKMIDGIADDFVSYVMHLEVVVEQSPARRPQCAVLGARGSGQGSGSVRQAAARQPVDSRGPTLRPRRGPDETAHGRHRGAQRAREDRSQPAVPVRERQEVQALSRAVAAVPAAPSIR